MNWLFRRHFWILHLFFLSVVAAVLAITTSTILGFWLSKSIPDVDSDHLKQAPKEVVEYNDYESVSERNLFSARREELLIEDEEEEKDRKDPGDWREASLSRLPLKLISTMLFDDPYESRAVIQITSTGDSGVYTIKDCLPYQKTNDRSIETVLPPSHWIPERACNEIKGQAKVVRIEENKVYILSDNYGYEYLLLGTERKTIKPIQKVQSVDEGDGIRKVGPYSYHIEQKAFDKALSNVTKLMMDARAMPVSGSQGKFEGFKITYVRKDSLIEKIGIQAGDILTRVNGYDLDSPQTAIELFGKLRFSDKFTIDVKRDDRLISMDYSVIP